MKPTALLIWRWFRSNAILQVSVLIVVASAIAMQFSREPATSNLWKVNIFFMALAIATVCWMIGEEIFRKDPRQKRRHP